MQKFKNNLARIVSTLLVPPSFTLIIFVLFALKFENDLSKLIVTIIVAFIFGFIAPIILFLHYRKKGLIVDLDASVKEERTVPMLISVLFFIAGLIFLILFNVNIVTIAFWFCYISNTIITVLINKQWKISAHTMGAAGPLAAVTYIFGPVALLFSMIVILVGWSRIQLKCHTFAQVLAGGLFAFFSTYLQIYYIVKLF